jgi:hypothetical protein
LLKLELLLKLLLQLDLEWVHSERSKKGSEIELIMDLPWC